MTLCPQPDGSVLQFIPSPALPVGIGLTPKQAATLRWLRDHFAVHGASPTFDDIRRGMGATSLGEVSRRLNALRERGYITRQPRAPRSIRLLDATAHRRGVQS